MLKIKKAYEDHVIGFNNSSLPLGKRTDLDKIYQFAKRKNLQRWLDWFEEVPDDKELQATQAKRFLEKQQQKAQQRNAQSGSTTNKADSAEGTS